MNAVYQNIDLKLFNENVRNISVHICVFMNGLSYTAVDHDIPENSLSLINLFSQQSFVSFFPFHSFNKVNNGDAESVCRFISDLSGTPKWDKWFGFGAHAITANTLQNSSK